MLQQDTLTDGWQCGHVSACILACGLYECRFSLMYVMCHAIAQNYCAIHNTSRHVSRSHNQHILHKLWYLWTGYLDVHDYFQCARPRYSCSTHTYQIYIHGSGTTQASQDLAARKHGGELMLVWRSLWSGGCKFCISREFFSFCISRELFLCKCIFCCIHT